ncbi:MAG: DegT/DnrJ/EryC1/StrS family aminotransferase [Caldilineaceae bacterium]|nr:DegT/DnrJ/EryC1/StrS family aminotransferase [Caldilineaceae bacterium]
MSTPLAIHGGPPVRTQPFGPTHDFGEDDVEAVAAVIRSGKIGKGAQVAQFEQAFAAKHGVKHGIAINSGTSALHLCVAAINPDPGDEIIVTAWTSAGSLIGSLLHNCVPIFADIDETYTLDPKDVEAKITPRTRAIIAVHLFGNPCNMAALREIAQRHQIFLIEDCCQAHFAEYQGQVVGSMGDINGFSFGGKHLSAGMGGAVLTNNQGLWERAVLFGDAALPRANGPYAGRPYANYFLGPNYRINDMIGAILLSQLNKVDGYIERKIYAAQHIIEQVADIDAIKPQVVRPGDRHTYWVLGFTLDADQFSCDAWEFAAALNKEGIPAGGPYLGSSKEGPLYRNPFLAEPNCYGRSRFPFDYGRDKPIDYQFANCPNGEALMQRSFNIAMQPSFDDAVIADISQAIRKVALHYRKPVYSGA